MLPNYIRTKLMEACSPSHKLIENSYPFNRLMSGNISEAELISILNKLYGIHLGIKRFLTFALDSHPAAKFIDKACRLEEIRSDLANFNTNPDHLETEVDFPYTTPYAIGVLYVVLGSTLGGAVIAKILSKNEYPKVGQAINFYVGDPDGRNNSWREFLEILENTKLSQGDELSIIIAAKNTFTLFQQNFLDLEVLVNE